MSSHLFIQSSVGRHVGWVHNLFLHVTQWRALLHMYFVFLSKDIERVIFPVAEVLEQRVCDVWNSFIGIAKLSSKMVATVCSPPCSHENSCVTPEIISGIHRRRLEWLWQVRQVSKQHPVLKNACCYRIIRFLRSSHFITPCSPIPKLDNVFFPLSLHHIDFLYDFICLIQSGIEQLFVWIWPFLIKHLWFSFCHSIFL